MTNFFIQHNYARLNGDIVGQSKDALTDDHLVQLWTLLAQHYSTTDGIMFGIMNEPHDLDTGLWAETAQKVVTAIRDTGAIAQPIILPGSNWTHLINFEEWYPYLKGIHNPDGSTTGLIFDLHHYMDSDDSGRNAECVVNTLDSFVMVQKILFTDKRQAIVTEMGGGNNLKCSKELNSQLTFLHSYPDQFVGFSAWSAGSISVDSSVTLTPVNGVDQLLWTASIKKFLS